MSTINRFTHPQLGFSIELPPAAEVIDDVAEAVLVAADPAGDSGDAFRANLVVIAEELARGAGPDVEAFADAALAQQATALVGFRLIDREPMQLDCGVAAVRLLGHHDVAGQAVTIEQWLVVAGDLAYTVTASCWTLDYDVLADAFAASAETFRP